MLSKYKYCIKSEVSDLKLIPHPKKSLKIQANEIGDKYASLFPKDMVSYITYFSAVSFTIGSINKNNCLILPDEGIKNYKTSTSMPIDIEHQKEQIVGFCINSYLTNIKNNKILSEDEAQQILDSSGKVNVGVVLGVWPLNNPEIDELIRENFDENSEHFNTVKLSFECYFSDFKYFISNGNLDYPYGDVCPSDNPDSDDMWNALRTNGGTGMYKGNKISICPIDSFIGGNGLVMNPANIFSDLTSQKEGDVITLQNIEMDDKKTNLPIIPVMSDELDNKNETKSVILNKEENMSIPNTNTDPIKAEVAAMAAVPVDSDFAQALQSELDKKIAELAAKDNKVLEIESKLNEDIKKLQDEVALSRAEFSKATEMAVKIQAQLDVEIEKRKNLETQEIERKHREITNARLATLAEFMDITEVNLAILEKQCSETSNEEFAAQVEFYKSLSPKVVVASEAQTSEDVKGTVQNAVADTAKDAKSVNIITPTPSVSLVEKFATAFNVESLGFKFKRQI